MRRMREIGLVLGFFGRHDKVILERSYIRCVGIGARAWSDQALIKCGRPVCFLLIVRLASEVQGACVVRELAASFFHNGRRDLAIAAVFG